MSHISIPDSYVCFNCVYHGDKVTQICIERSKFNSSFTYDHLGSLVSKKLKFAFVFMSLSKPGTIFDIGYGNCYSNFRAEIDENFKAGKGAYCGIYVARYVSKKIGYISPLKECKESELRIFCDRINDIRVVASEMTPFQNVISNLKLSYSLKSAYAKHNKSLTDKIKLDSGYKYRFNAMEMLAKISSKKPIIKTSDLPAKLQDFDYQNDPNFLKCKVLMFRTSLMFQIECSIASRTLMYPQGNSQLPDIIILNRSLSSGTPQGIIHRHTRQPSTVP